MVDSSGIDTITSTIARNLLGYPTIENLTLLNVERRSTAGTGNNPTMSSRDNIGNNILTGGIGADRLRRQQRQRHADRRHRHRHADRRPEQRFLRLQRAAIGSPTATLITDFNHAADTFGWRMR